MLDMNAVYTYLLQLGAVPAGTESARAIEVLLNSDIRRADTWSEALGGSRRTLLRRVAVETGRLPVKWVQLVKVLRLWNEMNDGKTLLAAVQSTGDPDSFTASNLCLKVMGVRPTVLRTMEWQAVVDLWVQRHPAPRAVNLVG